MDPPLDRLFSTLEAQFGASIDRAEDEAASDLAISLRQDMALRDALLRGSWVAATARGRLPVYEVAKDHVVLGTERVLVPLNAVIFVRGGHRTAVSTDRALAEVLRRHSRTGTHLSVETGEASAAGRVTACSATHLALQGPAGEFLIPLSQILSVKPFHED